MTLFDSNPQHPLRFMIRNGEKHLLLLLLLSLFLSAYLFFKTYVLSLDGAFQYIPAAELFAEGFFRRALASTGQQPLYSFLVGMVSKGVPDFEVAGKLVSSFFGILIILPVYFLGKRIFSKETAFISAIFLAIHPYLRRYSADVLKESTYLFFLMAALWFTWRTIQEEKRSAFIWVPLFTAIAYLTRPDGIEILLILFLYLLFIKKFNHPREKVWAILLVLFSSIVLFLPYLLFLKGETGTWTLSRVKGIPELLGWGGMAGSIPLTYKIIYSIKKLNLETFAIYHPIYLFFLAIGLYRKFSSRLRPGEGFLFFLFFLHYGVLFLLGMNFTQWDEDQSIKVSYLSGRHVLPLLLFSVYWVGEGCGVVWDWIQRKWGSIQLLKDWGENRKSILIGIILLILVLAVVLPKTLKPQRYERLSEKMVGLWIKSQSGEGVTILTTSPRVAFYARGTYELIDLNKDTPDKIEALYDQLKASYLVVKGEEAADDRKKIDSIPNKFVQIFQYEKEGMEKMIVYRKVY